MSGIVNARENARLIFSILVSYCIKKILFSKRVHSILSLLYKLYYEKKEIFESKGRKYFNCFKISQLYLKRFSNVEEELIIYISPGSSVNIFHFEI